jgi:hypothetical protein
MDELGFFFNFNWTTSWLNLIDVFDVGRFSTFNIVYKSKHNWFLIKLQNDYKFEWKWKDLFDYVTSTSHIFLNNKIMIKKSKALDGQKGKNINRIVD